MKQSGSDGLSNVERGWAQALTLLPEAFHDFMTFFFPEHCAAIDWTKPARLRKHMRAGARGKEAQHEVVDRLLEVCLHDGAGGERWVLVHVLVQAEKDVSLARRVFDYNCRIATEYRRPVASLVLLVDDDPDWRPSALQGEALGTTVQFSFAAAKLLDYEERAMRSVGLA